MIKMLRHEMCFAFVEEANDMMSVGFIISMQEGKGHARGMMEKITSTKVKEIRLLAVESAAIEHLAKEMGYSFVNYTKDADIVNRPDWEYMDDFSHRATKLMECDIPFSFPEILMKPRPDLIGYRKMMA